MPYVTATELILSRALPTRSYKQIEELRRKIGRTSNERTGLRAELFKAELHCGAYTDVPGPRYGAKYVEASKHHPYPQETGYNRGRKLFQKTIIQEVIQTIIESLGRE